MKLSATVLLLFVTATILAFAHSADKQPSDKQPSEKRDIGKDFILAVCTGEYQTAWQLLSPAVQRERPYGTFVDMATSLGNVYEAQGHPDIEPYRSGFVMIGDKKSRMQQYRFANDASASIPVALFEVVFDDSSNQIARFIPRIRAAEVEEDSRVATSEGREDAIEGEQVWIVAGDTAQVREVAVVFFGSEVMLVVKVLRRFPDDITQQQSRAAAIPIVQYALEHGYAERARQYAEKNGMSLVASVGVAFIQPGTTRSYRVKVDPSDYAR